MTPVAATTLPDIPENRNARACPPDRPHVPEQNISGPDTEKQQLIERLREGRRRAIPKAVYAAAVKAHCLECCGVNPSITNCGGASLSDGSACRLFEVNSPTKRRNTTKTRLKKSIRQECLYCGGEPETCGACNLRIIKAKMKQ